MPFKATSSDLNRVSKKEHHQEEGGLAQDVNAQAQVSIKVEGLTVKQRVGSDEKETGRWIDRGEEGGGCRRGIWENHTGLRGGKAR